MTVTRRGFLTGMLALGAAPAIVRAESLMHLWVPPQGVLTLDMLRRVTRTLQENRVIPIGEDYVIYIDPASRYGDLTGYTVWQRTDNGLYLQDVRNG